MTPHVSPTLRDLMRDEMRVREILDRMAELARPADPEAADRFKSIQAQVGNAVQLYSLGSGNPRPAVPAYLEIGGEGG